MSSVQSFTLSSSTFLTVLSIVVHASCLPKTLSSCSSYATVSYYIDCSHNGEVTSSLFGLRLSGSMVGTLMTRRQR